MKTVLITLFVLFLIISFSQAFTMGSIFKIEKARYEILRKEKKFEIRKYHSGIHASVTMPGTYDKMSGNAFRVLAGYIFGANQQNMKIAMTTPVQMDLGESSTTMRFMMPSRFSYDDLPLPNDPRIWFEETNPVIKASITFGGYANDNKIDDKIRELSEYLEKKGIEHTNDFSFLGYNPPFQFAGRRNEITVTLLNYITTDAK